MLAKLSAALTIKRHKPTKTSPATRISRRSLQCVSRETEYLNTLSNENKCYTFKFHPVRQIKNDENQKNTTTLNDQQQFSVCKEHSRRKDNIIVDEICYVVYSQRVIRACRASVVRLVVCKEIRRRRGLRYSAAAAAAAADSSRPRVPGQLAIDRPYSHYIRTTRSS